MAIALEIYEALRSVGVADAEAKSTAEKFDQALDSRFQLELKSLATREDLANVRAEIGNLRAELLGEMGKLESRLIRWNVGTMIAVAGLTLAIVKLVG